MPPSNSELFDSDDDSDYEDEDDEDSNGKPLLLSHINVPSIPNNIGFLAEDWYTNDYPEEDSDSSFGVQEEEQDSGMSSILPSRT